MSVWMAAAMGGAGKDAVARGLRARVVAPDLFIPVSGFCWR